MSRRSGLWRGRAVFSLASILVSGALALGATSFAAVNSTGIDGASSGGLETAVRMNPPTTTAPPITVAPGPTIPAAVQAMLDRSNAQRAWAGIGPLTYSDALSAAADMHGNDQRNKPCVGGSLTHTGTDGSNAGDRIARTGLSVGNWAENIACGYSTVDAVMTGWMSSAGHRANILNPALTHMGASLTYSDGGQPYWVQVFGTPR